jgi:hypothetical protein
MRHPFRVTTHVWNGREFTLQESKHYPNGNAMTTQLPKLVRKTATARKVPIVAIVEERKPDGPWFPAGRPVLGTVDGKLYGIPLEAMDWQGWVIQQLGLVPNANLGWR